MRRAGQADHPRKKVNRPQPYTDIAELLDEAGTEASHQGRQHPLYAIALPANRRRDAGPGRGHHKDRGPGDSEGEREMRASACRAALRGSGPERPGADVGTAQRLMGHL